MSGGENCSVQPTDVISSVTLAFIPWRCQKIAEEYKSESMALNGSEKGLEILVFIQNCHSQKCPAPDHFTVIGTVS
jgi:hypothetical protein